MGTIASTTRSIESDHKDIKEIFAAAKMGDWATIWRIIGTPDRPHKPYLLNLIPEDRRWGIIQQAVYWNNKEVVRKLLKFPTCDTKLKAKDGISEKGHTGGNTAEQIAKLFGHLEVSVILSNHMTNQNDENIDTFYRGPNEIQNEEYGLFRLTLAAYKNTFHPSHVNQSKSLPDLLNDIFRYVSSGRNWMVVRDRVAQSLYPACQEAGRCIQECTTRKDFYKMVINVYTDETTQLYTYLNTALRRQRDNGYKPTGNDLALGPYILMFHLLLFCWNSLEREKHTTYRKMQITASDLEKYQVGTKFTWLSFVSSSVEKQCAQIFPSCEPSGEIKVDFVIDNKANSQWQPLNIEDYACYMEKERVYPAGSTFEVIRRSNENGTPTIKLKLVGVDDANVVFERI